MDGAASDNVLDPPPRLYERLRQIAGYSWDESIPPFHSTYDFWYVHYRSQPQPSSQPSRHMTWHMPALF